MPCFADVAVLLLRTDTILVLDKALQTSALSLDVYLKQVRQLCAKQFMARALGLKVGAAQRGAPRPLRNSGSVSYPIAHGDSWSSTGILHNPLAHGDGSSSMRAALGASGPAPPGQ